MPVIKIGGLEIELRSTSTKFVQGMDQARNQVQSFTSTFRKMQGVLIGGAGAAGFAVAIKGAIDYANTLGDLNTRLGFTTEFLSRMKFAAESSGVEFRSLVTSAQRFTRRLAEAAEGSGPLVSALEDLNLEADKLIAMGTDEAFLAWSDALSQVEDKGKRASLAMKGMDTEGVALTQILDQGADAMRALGDESDRLGLTISQNTATAATEFNFRLGQLKGTAQGWINTITAEMLPTMVRFQDVFVGAGSGMDKARTAGQALDGALRALLATGTVVTEVFNTAGRAFGALAAATSFALEGEFGRARRVLSEFKADFDGAVTDTLERVAQITGRLQTMQTTFSRPGEGGGRSGAPPPAPRRPPGPRRQTRAEADAQAALNAAMAEGVRIMESLRSPSEELMATMQRLNELRDLGAISQETFNRAQARATEQFREQMEAMREMEPRFSDIVDAQLEKTKKAQEEIARNSEMMQRQIFGTLERSLDGVLRGTVTARQAFTQLITDLSVQLARLAAQKGFAALFGGGAQPASAGGGFGGFFGGLFGFQQGGSFTVGGRGGSDSQLVAFRATPGERVSVDTGDSPRGAAGFTVIQNNSFAGGVGDRLTRDQLAALSGAAMRDALARNGRA